MSQNTPPHRTSTANNPQPFVLFDNLTAELDGRTLLKEETLVIKPGEITVLTGPSGVDKSVLADLVFNLPGRGGVQLQADVLGESRAQGALVFRDSGGLPHLSVNDNLRLVSGDQYRCEQLADRFGLEPEILASKLIDCGDDTVLVIDTATDGHFRHNVLLRHWVPPTTPSLRPLGCRRSPNWLGSPTRALICLGGCPSSFVLPFSVASAPCDVICIRSSTVEVTYMMETLACSNVLTEICDETCLFPSSRSISTGGIQHVQTSEYQKTHFRQRNHPGAVHGCAELSQRRPFVVCW